MLCLSTRRGCTASRGRAGACQCSLPRPLDGISDVVFEKGSESSLSLIHSKGVIHRSGSKFETIQWNGLGGKFEAGETPEECVRREVEEESGLFIQNPRLHGLLMFPKSKGNDWYVFVFTASEFSDELNDSPEGKLE
jgi:ADP-ribose pyrophosphatase YjhB (NUDIX family)